MSVTFDSLVAQISAELERNDPSTLANIPIFINNAQQRICRDSKNIGFEAYATGVFKQGEPVVAKPGRWRRTLSINFGIGTDFNTRIQLVQRGYEFLRMYAPDATKQAPPIYYSDYGYTHLLIAPSPDLAYPFEICYLELPQPLTESFQTNWLTNYAPDLLFYGSLVEAALFLKNFDQVAAWDDQYQKRLASINDQDDRRFTDRASERRSD
jgi:hypothetical protein